MAKTIPKKRQSTRTIREKMLCYLNRFKLRKKQIKYKPRTYANLQGINSLRSQNAINIEPPKPVIKESVKARLNCNLNALLQLDNEKNLNSKIRRIKPQESYINMELNVKRKNPKRNPQPKEVDLESEQDDLSKNGHSEFALEPLDSDYRSDFDSCFEIQNERSLHGQKNYRKRESSLPTHLRKQRKNNNEFHDFSPLLIQREVSIPAKQKSNGRNGPDQAIEFTGPSFNKYDQSESFKQKELRRINDTFNTKQKYSQNEYETSTPLKSMNQRSNSRFVFPDSPSKFPSIIHSDGRFNRNHNREVTRNTRTSSMLDKVFYERSFNKTSLRSKKTSPETKQRNDETFDFSFHTEPFERNKNNAFVNPPSTVYSSVGSEYVESFDTIRNGVRAGHGNEPPTLPGIPDKVFFERPIHYYERSPSESLMPFTSSNFLSALASFVQSNSVSECSQIDRPSIFSASFTRTIIKGQNTYGEIIHRELRKSR